MSTGSPCKRRRHHTRRGCTQHQKAQHPTTNAPLSKPICLTVASSSGSTSLSESSDTDTSIAQRGALEQLPCATAAAYATAKTQAAPAAPTNTRAQLGGTRHYARRHQPSSKDGTDSARVRTAHRVRNPFHSLRWRRSCSPRTPPEGGILRPDGASLAQAAQVRPPPAIPPLSRPRPPGRIGQHTDVNVRAFTRDGGCGGRALAWFEGRVGARMGCTGRVCRSPDLRPDRWRAGSMARRWSLP